MKKWHISDGWMILGKANGRWEVLRQWDMRLQCYVVMLFTTREGARRAKKRRLCSTALKVVRAGRAT